MADCDCLDNEEQLDSEVSQEEQLESEFESPTDLTSDMLAIQEVSRQYTGIENENIEVVVDNDDYTIEAVLKKDIPAKTSDLTNDGDDGTSPFATQNFVQDNTGSYTGIEKKSDYFYEVNYDFIDYDFANEYFQNRRPNINLGMCSSVRNGDLYGRNLDWLYNNDVEFKVNVKNSFGKNASFGIASTVRDGENALTKEFVESGAYSELYKILPFMIVDGQNQYGVTCNTNVVPRQKNNGSIIGPSGTVEKTICQVMLNRYILDNFKTAQEAVEYISEHIALYPLASFIEDYDYDQHWMVADENKTYLIECVNSQIVVTDISQKPYMTNFYLNGVTLNSDNKVYTPADVPNGHLPTRDNGITTLGSGLERYNLIVDNYSNSNTETGMKSLMRSLFYTRAYNTSPNPSNPTWYTEFVGIDNLTVDSTPTQYASIEEIAGREFINRTREDSTTWQSVHSVVYNIKEKTMNIVVQEDISTETTFKFDFAANPELEERIKTLEENVETISVEIDTINTDINNINNEIDTINGNIETLSNGVSENAQAIQELNNDVDSIETNITSLGNRITTNEGNISDLQSRMNTAESDIDTAQANITTLSNGLNEAEQDIQELQNDVDALETSKQDKLVSGQNIKTINNQSVLGSGNIELSVASKYIINVSGDTGTLTDTEYNTLVDDSKNVVIRNGVEEYTLKAIETNYRVYMAENTPSDTEIKHYAIWVQISPQAVNYKHWSKEPVNPKASSVEWGDITGNIDTQTDLQTKFTIFDNKLNQQVSVKQTGDNFTYNGDTVKFKQKFVNLKTGTEETTEEVVGLADSDNAGMMSPSDVQALADLRDEVDRLAGRNIRLLFTAKDNPDAIDINLFVLGKGYAVADFPSISVVVRGTNHIWRYSENPAQWLDYGIDTVNQATNQMLGIVKGTSNVDGKVYVENDGSMSVYGWDSLSASIPTKTSDLTNDSGFIDKSVNDLTNYTKTSDLGDLAAQDSVDYETQVTNKPTIPDIVTSISDSPANNKVVSESAIYNYIASGNNGKTRTLDGIDLNTITATGMYSCNVCTNRPTANNGVMLVLKNGFSSDNLVQVYWTFTADVMWVRHKDLGNWKAWKSIVKSDELPTVNNPTITFKQGTTTKGTITLNQASDQTITFDAGGGSSVDIDNTSITENTDGEIQTVGVIDQKTGNANKEWTGTLAEYNAITTKDANTIYHITDDNTADIVDSTPTQNSPNLVTSGGVYNALEKSYFTASGVADTLITGWSGIITSTFTSNDQRNFTYSDGKFTCQKSGKYLIVGTASFLSNDSNTSWSRYLYLEKNNSGVCYTKVTTNPANQKVNLSINKILDLSVGDEVHLKIAHDNGSESTNCVACTFSGVEI